MFCDYSSNFGYFASFWPHNLLWAVGGSVISGVMAMEVLIMVMVVHMRVIGKGCGVLTSQRLLK